MIYARSILTKTKLYAVDYTLNPYRGCGHRCVYCYVPHLPGFDEHINENPQPKINAISLLRKEIRTKKPGLVMISSATDPYQPLERKYMITRKALELFSMFSEWRIRILTKSALVLRDLDLLKRIRDVEVGLTITTDDEKIRMVMEPHAPSIKARINALKTLKENNIRTYASLAPLLPMNPERLARMLAGVVDYVFIDTMHYPSMISHVLVKHGWEFVMKEQWQEEIIYRLHEALRGKVEIVGG